MELFGKLKLYRRKIESMRKRSIKLNCERKEYRERGGDKIKEEDLKLSNRSFYSKFPEGYSSPRGN